MVSEDRKGRQLDLCGFDLRTAPLLANTQLKEVDLPARNASDRKGYCERHTGAPFFCWPLL